MGAGEAPARERSRLGWRCRRGIRELDVLLEGYLATGYAAAPAGEQAAFRELLERENAELIDLLAGRIRAGSAALRALIARLAAGPGRGAC